MPGKIISFLLIFVLGYWVIGLFSSFSSPILAHSIPTPTATSGQLTCDLCGWCNQALNPTPPANWNACRSCLYETDPITGETREKGNTYYAVLGCLSTKPEFFVQTLLSIVFAASGGIAFLAVLAGTVIVLTSSGYPERLQTGKDLIMSSLFGLLLIIFAVFLLRVVGFDILKIPGFG